MYASIGIEEAIIGRTLSTTYSKDRSHSHSWNDKDHAFGYQLDEWGVDMLFHNSYGVIIREMNLYDEDREK